MHHDPQPGPRPARLRRIAEIWTQLTPDEQHLARALVDELAAPTLSAQDHERLLTALASLAASEDGDAPSEATIRALLDRTRPSDQPRE